MSDQNEEIGNGDLDKDKQLTSPTVKKEKDCNSSASGGATNTTGGKRDVKKEHNRDQHRAKDAKIPESEIVRDLKAQLK